MWNTVVSKGRLSAFALFLSLSGCTALSDCKYEVGQKIRTHQAWSEFDGCHHQCFTSDYRDGWKAGFYDVATGGSGCPPVIAPKKYWKPPVFCQHDPSRRDEWYAGFQDGAACGKCQPDHHYLQTFLPPRNCCPTVTVSYPNAHHAPTDFPIEHIHSDTAPTPDAESAGELSAPEQAAPLQPGSQQPGTQPSASPAPSTQPSPTDADSYEKDPAPATSQSGPGSNQTLRQRLVQQYQQQQNQQIQEQARVEKRESLLQQLVLNVANTDEPNGF